MTLWVDQGKIPAPNLIKVDVEGHDAHVIKGGLGTIRKHRPVVLCDYKGEQTLPGVRELLEPLAYEVSGTTRTGRKWGLPITGVPTRKAQKPFGLPVTQHATNDEPKGDVAFEWSDVKRIV